MIMNARIPSLPHPREPIVKCLPAHHWIRRRDFREDWSSQIATFLERVGLDLGPKGQRGRLGRAKQSNSPIRRTAEQKHRRGKALICAGHSEESGLLRQSCWLGAVGRAGEG